MAKKKFLIVSNRLPVNVSKNGNKLEFSASAGGLATAVSRFHKNKSNTLWIGWPGICSEDVTNIEKLKITQELKSQGYFPIFLTREQVKNYYDGYANNTIWPLFHYFQSIVKHDLSYWQGYCEVNDIFAKAVLKHADAEATIWVHDYHLMLLPGKLRSQLPDSSIGFFLHVPFPSYEIFRLLPNRAEILEGLLGADLIGFHVYDYARHFLKSTLRVIGLESNHGTLGVGRRLVRVDAFPIGIDYKKFAGSHKDKKTIAQIKSLNQYYRDKKIILSMDRLDYSKGILRRLAAFEHFLQNNPKYREQVVLVMVVVPSRVEVPSYQQLKKEIEQVISRINGEYSTVNWTPISYQFRNLPFEQVAALLNRADVALLTPLRDGMNLVAKEYIATKQNKGGVLILSEMTGAIDEMPEALSVNPNDLIAIERAIKEALTMPLATQKQKIKSMQNRLSYYTVNRWAEDFIEQLKRSKGLQAGQVDKLFDSRKEKKLVRSFKKAKNRIIMLDYDGTLTDIVDNPEPSASVPSPKLLNILRKLANMPNTIVCIVSGRPKGVMEKWFGKLPISLSAEHGAWLKIKGEWSRHDVSLSEYRTRIIDLLKVYSERTPGATIEVKDFSIVWHYRNVPSELAQARNASIEYELTNILGNSEFAVFKGDKILEIKPGHINKGLIAEELLATYKSDFVLAIGDDNTDEDIFKVLPNKAFSIKVGLGDSNARLQILRVQDVIKLLDNLAKSR